jgi:hypothetical protein
MNQDRIIIFNNIFIKIYKPKIIKQFNFKIFFLFICFSLFFNGCYSRQQNLQEKTIILNQQQTLIPLNIIKKNNLDLKSNESFVESTNINNLNILTINNKDFKIIESKRYNSDNFILIEFILIPNDSNNNDIIIDETNLLPLFEKTIAIYLENKSIKSYSTTKIFVLFNR